LFTPLPRAYPLPQLSGTTERPRLAVFRSNEHIYAQVGITAPTTRTSTDNNDDSLSQVIDDIKGTTLASASTLTKGLREALPEGNGANQVRMHDNLISGNQP
jgi:large subunit ribosomal protein L18